ARRPTGPGRAVRGSPPSRGGWRPGRPAWSPGRRAARRRTPRPRPSRGRARRRTGAAAVPRTRTSEGALPRAAGDLGADGQLQAAPDPVKAEDGERQAQPGEDAEPRAEV